MRRALVFVAAPALAAAPAFAEGGLASVRTAQLPSDARVQNAAPADIDGDGRSDLIVSVRLRKEGRPRALSIFRQRGAETLVPEERLELTPDVVAWAVGDVHADRGDEVVLFNAGGVFVWRPGKPAEERFERLVEASFLWQLPDPDEVFQWTAGVRDLNGDGLVDLVLPEPGGYRIALQERTDAGASFAATSVLHLPREPAAGGAWVSAAPGGSGWRGGRSDGELRLSLSVNAGVDDEYELPSTLLSMNELVPAPQLVDWDGDGDLDLLAQSWTRLHVFTQSQGAFGDEGRRSFSLPVEADRDRKLDASYSSHAVDLNGDSKADCVIFAGDKRSSDVRTQSLIFVQGAGRGDAAQTPSSPLFGPRGRPQDLLVFAGFVATVRFERVDADEFPDMVVTAVRPDLIDQLRAVSSESIGADLFVYLNRRGRFSRRPDMSWRMDLPLQRFHATARFVGDLTGDGTSELMVRDKPERLRLLMVRARRGQDVLDVIDRPLWELAVAKRAEIEVLETPALGALEVLVIERNQVLHVSFP